MVWSKTPSAQSWDAVTPKVATRTPFGPATLASGTLAVVMALVGSDPTGFTTDAATTGDWVQLDSDIGSSTSTGLQIYYAVGTGASSTLKLKTTNGANWCYILYTITGEDTSNPIDAHTINRDSTVEYYTGQAAPSYKGGLYLACHGWMQNSSGSTYVSFTPQGIHQGSSFQSVDVSATGGTGSGDTSRIKLEAFSFIPDSGMEDHCDHSGDSGTSSPVNHVSWAGIIRIASATAVSTTAVSGSGSAAYVQSVANGGTASTALTLTLTNNPVANNMLVAIIALSLGSGTTETIAPPDSNWQQVYGGVTPTSTQKLQLFVFRRVSAGSGDGKVYTFTWAASWARVGILAEYSGSNLTPLGFVAHTHTGNDTSTTGGSRFGSANLVLPSAASDALLLAFLMSGPGLNGTLGTASNSYNFRKASVQGTQLGIALFDRTANAGTSTEMAVDVPQETAGNQSLDRLGLTMAFGAYTGGGADAWAWVG